MPPKTQPIEDVALEELEGGLVAVQVHRQLQRDALAARRPEGLVDGGAISVEPPRAVVPVTVRAAVAHAPTAPHELRAFAMK
ncbi:hypothetical protein JRI60_01665 [Archangium violaceum]|uniref:hypothetical protein n=1 Tax=Archangium violaceum TaxID=83451 RepID=UPI00194FFA34|nr:hypothetical protein [Archangium violaceum]QRN97818.1 hypothetical protein JRI60_01665 [Archangium violaceum]